MVSERNPLTLLSVPVALGDRSYSILIAPGMIASGQAAEQIVSLARGSRVCMVTHPGLCAAYAQPLEEGLRAIGIPVTTVTVPPGERMKNLRAVARLYGQFLAAGLDRQGL